MIDIILYGIMYLILGIMYLALTIACIVFIIQVIITGIMIFTPIKKLTPEEKEKERIREQKEFTEKYGGYSYGGSSSSSKSDSSSWDMNNINTINTCL